VVLGQIHLPRALELKEEVKEESITTSRLAEQIMNLAPIYGEKAEAMNRF
jgi:hypothetical protein